MSSIQRFFVAVLLGCCLLPLSACLSPPAIQQYKVPRKTPDLLLGGMVLRGDVAWFFKLTGPRVELTKKQGDFRQFLASVEFSSDSEALPTWSLPDGWTVDPRVNPNRKATILVPLENKTAELTVTVLPLPAGDQTEYVARNVNRWRGQMKQTSLSQAEVATLDKISAKNAEVWFIAIAGEQAAGGMMAPGMGS